MYGLLLAGCDDYAVSEDGKADVLLDIPLFGNAFMRMPVIVTFNLSDFPPDVLAGHNFESRHPDEFLASRFDAEPGPVHRAVRRQREKLKHPLVHRSNLPEHLFGYGESTVIPVLELDEVQAMRRGLTTGFVNIEGFGADRRKARRAVVRIAVINLQGGERSAEC
jgi:hypothetical protein